MKMNKVITFLYVVFFLGGILLVQFSSKKSKAKRKDLTFHGGYTIGEFVGRSSSVSSNSRRTSSVVYRYVIDSKSYKRSDTGCMGDSPKAATAFTNPDKAKPGDKFLVLFNKEYPEESIIRLDYPIKDSTDFMRYVKEFEEMRKQKNKN